MPYKPKVSCRHPGCAALVPAGQKYCEEQKPLHASPAMERYYGSQWRKASNAFLLQRLLCAKCRGERKLVKATALYHNIPHHGDQELFRERANW